MGHYWSEMAPPVPERHPRPLEALDFVKLDGYMWNLFYHKPCKQVFYIINTYKLDDAIWRHGNECK